MSRKIRKSKQYPTVPQNKRKLKMPRIPKLRNMRSEIKKDLFNIPNSLTMLRIFLVPFAVVLLSYQTPLHCLLATLVFAVASATDFFDGYLARKLNLVSITGKFFDPLADKLMVMALTVQLAAMGWLEAWIPIVILAREFAVQGLRQIASSEGMVIAAGSGGKIKTALQMIGIVGLLLHYSYDMSPFFPGYNLHFHFIGKMLVIISIVFSIASMIEYFRNFVNAIGDSQPERPE